MEGRKIPGYYFDEEKKKYFKITADHIIPNSNAKYSQSNVEFEQRKVKKQKIEKAKNTRRLQQIVKRNRALHEPLLGGIGLLREQGKHPRSALHNVRNEAFVAGWHPCQADLNENGWELTYGHVESTTRTLIYALKVFETDEVASHFEVRSAPLEWTTEHLTLGAYHAFPTRVDSITSTSTGNCVRMLATSGEHFFLGPTPTDWQDQSSIPFVGYRSGSQGLMGKFQHETGTALGLWRRYAHVFDQDFNRVNGLEIKDVVDDLSDSGEEEYGPTTDWLDANTVAFHYNSTSSRLKSVMLWDTRCGPGAIAIRFKPNARTTGVLCPANAGCPSSGNSIIVSTNHDIRLYDTRMPRNTSHPDNPLLSFTHTHQGPKLHFAINGQGLLAAVDRDRYMQIYSTRSGKSLDSAAACDCSERGMSWKEACSNLEPEKGLQWYEDEYRGPSLLTFTRDMAFRWS